MPCSLHSDSDHQTNNSRTQPLASSMSISSSTCCVGVYPQSPGTRFHCMLHQLYSTWHIHLHLQGKFLHLPGRLSGTFHIARSQCKLVFLCHDLKEDLMGTKFLLYLYICQICCLRLGLRSSGFTYD